MTVSILDLMDCRVKTLRHAYTKERISKVSILDLMDCRVKTIDEGNAVTSIIMFQSLI